MLMLYRLIVQAATPFLKFYLRHRLAKGKEDPTRLHERFGGASFSRPSGKLLWFHGASVGESLSILNLLKRLRERHPEISILVTTGTVTSAQLMAQKLPQGVIHQYIPLDVPRWVGHFLDHWKPDQVVILESELWPNLLQQIKQRRIPLILLNARLSERSYRRWLRFPKTAQSLLGSFDLCITASSITAKHLQELGAKKVEFMHNLKFTSTALTFDPEKALLLKNTIGSRRSWVAASTHTGEEEIVLNAHLSLKELFPDVLTILAPRHPHRAEEVIQLSQQRGLTIARFSEGHLPTQDIDIWLIDTIGDMGLIYHLTDIAFIGGSLVPIGGHNPIEAVQLGTVVIHGPYDANVSDIHGVLQQNLIAITHSSELMYQVAELMNDATRRNALIQSGLSFCQITQSHYEIIVNSLIRDMTP